MTVQEITKLFKIRVIVMLPILNIIIICSFIENEIISVFVKFRL